MEPANDGAGPERTVPAVAAETTGRAPAVRRAPERRLETQPPNLIFAFSDEHRWQSMSFTELPEVRTPHMAALAAQGAVFTHCISNYPVCSPMRAILMTGRWPYQQKMLDGSPGMIDNEYRLSPEQTCLGQVFRAAGYRTGYVGKWHLGGRRAEPFGFDFSLIWSRTNSHWRSLYHPARGEPVETQGYNAALMTDQALEFIDANRRLPFFLMLSWNPPHSDFRDAPEEMKALYPQRSSLPDRPNIQPARNARAQQRHWEAYRGYHAHVSAVDRELGRLMQALDAWGLAENTILIYASDHGSLLGSHGVGGKRQPYEESIRVPFIVRRPGWIGAGQRLSPLFGAIDMFPTLCGMAGIPVPRTCAGQDFSPWLRDGCGPDPESQFLMHIAKENASGGLRHPAPLFRGVVTRRWTYAAYPDGPWCLFDNENDPYQIENRLADPAVRPVRERLHAMTAEWLGRADDPLRLPPV